MFLYVVGSIWTMGIWPDIGEDGYVEGSIGLRKDISDAELT